MNKILIIDDDKELCALIKRSVQAENIEADFCNTGKEGFTKIKRAGIPACGAGCDDARYGWFETLEEIRKRTACRF